LIARVECHLVPARVKSAIDNPHERGRPPHHGYRTGSSPVCGRWFRPGYQSCLCNPGHTPFAPLVTNRTGCRCLVCPMCGRKPPAALQRSPQKTMQLTQQFKASRKSASGTEDDYCPSVSPANSRAFYVQFNPASELTQSPNSPVSGRRKRELTYSPLKISLHPIVHSQFSPPPLGRFSTGGPTRQMVFSSAACMSNNALAVWDSHGAERAAGPPGPVKATGQGRVKLRQGRLSIQQARTLRPVMFSVNAEQGAPASVGKTLKTWYPSQITRGPLERGYLSSAPRTCLW